jgi:hypothetical protein
MCAFITDHYVFNNTLAHHFLKVSTMMVGFMSGDDDEFFLRYHRDSTICTAKTYERRLDPFENDMAYVQQWVPLRFGSVAAPEASNN